MDATLLRFAAAQDNLVLRGQALEAGYSDYEIMRLIMSGRWHRVRRGVYADAPVWNGLDELARHRALTRAVVMQLSTPAVPSHSTAAVLRALPVWGVDLSVVHVTRSDLKSPRREAGVHHHVGPLEDGDVDVVDGMPVTGAARTVVDMARSEQFESAVVTADAALARPDLGKDDLLATLDRMRDWRGARNAGRVVSFADGRSESVGESRHRVQIHRIGLPPPELQVTISALDGHEDRVDFYFEDFSTVGEFDGRGKYGRLLQADDTPADAVWREKRREDRLREGGLEVVRPVWADLYRDGEVARRYRAAFARGGRRRRRIVI